MGVTVDPLKALLAGGVEKVQEQVYELELQKKALIKDLNLGKDLKKLYKEKNTLIQVISDLENEKLDKIKTLSATITKEAGLATKKIRAENAKAKAIWDEIQVNLNSVEGSLKEVREDYDNEIQKLAEIHNKIAEAQNEYDRDKISWARSLDEYKKDQEVIIEELDTKSRKISTESQVLMSQKAIVTAYTKDTEEALRVREAALTVSEGAVRLGRQKLDKDKAKFDKVSEEVIAFQITKEESQTTEDIRLKHIRQSMNNLDDAIVKRSKELRVAEIALKENKEALIDKEKKFKDEKRRFLAGR